MSWVHIHAAWIIAGGLFLISGWMAWQGRKDLGEDEAVEEGEHEKVDNDH